MQTDEFLKARIPMLVVVGFTAICVAGFGFLWIKAGGSVPGITHDQNYKVAFESTNIKNLKDLGDVRIAGVNIGKVESRTITGGKARVVLGIDKGAVPLHEGVTIRVGVKSLVGSSYVDIKDGSGSVIRNGATISNKSVKESVDVDELFNTFDKPTQDKIRGTAGSLAVATKGTGDNLDKTMTGVGELGTQGATVLDALAAQSDDLKALTRETTVLLGSLDTGRGQIADLVTDANTLTSATAGKADAVKATMRTLPELLTTVQAAAVKLTELAGPLSPIAKDLQKAAPDLNSALLQLPSATNDLHGLLPDLDATLKETPATLDRVPAVTKDTRTLIPQAQTLLRDVNPMLVYLAPYGQDVGAMFANFGASMNQLLPNGLSPLRLSATVSQNTLRGNPVKLPGLGLNWINPYPKPGTAGDPQPFTGTYPRVTRDPK